MTLNLFVDIVFGIVTVLSIAALITVMIRYPGTWFDGVGLFSKSPHKRAMRGMLLAYSIWIIWIFLLIIWLSIVSR